MREAQILSSEFYGKKWAQGGAVLAQVHKARRGGVRIQVPAAEGPKPIALNHSLRIQNNENDRLSESLILLGKNK